jgi:Asp-tRNA(Asn)/Glu-tRNA(Gln) amidotransferase C subunit
VIRRTAEMAALPLDDDRVTALAPLVEELLGHLERLRRLDPDGVDQPEPAFSFLPSAWTNQPS